ncbi:MAG: S66 peptidase family protein [Chitinophagaceae bacterium]
MTKIPPYLRPGDTIAISCPSSKMDFDLASAAALVLQDWGLKVKMGKTVGTSFHNFSAPDQNRREELQELMDDPTIGAILFGRGGYGMVRILDQLDFSHFQQAPKWLAGFSDITTLHIHLHQITGVASLHSPMCSGLLLPDHQQHYAYSLRNALWGVKCSYNFPTHVLNRMGSCQGPLIGGNLSLLSNLSGSLSQPHTTGKILFLEEVGEYRYHIDRMMINLKRSGWLQNLSGLIVGAFSEGKDTETPFGANEYEIILNHVAEFTYPVCFGFPVGHQPENYTLKSGMTHELEVGKLLCSLKELPLPLKG